MRAPRPIPGLSPRVNTALVRASWVAHLSVLAVIPAALGWQTLLNTARMKVLVANAVMGIPLLALGAVLVLSAAGRPVRWRRLPLYVAVMAAVAPAALTYDSLYLHAPPVFVIALGYIAGIVLARVAQAARHLVVAVVQEFREDRQHTRLADGRTVAVEPLP